MPVVLASKIQPLAGVPGREDRPQRRDELGHPGHRPVEVRTESLLDLRTDLGAEAQGETPAGKDLVVDGLVRQVNRVTGKRNCHIGHQVQIPDGAGQRQGVNTSWGLQR